MASLISNHFSAIDATGRLVQIGRKSIVLTHNQHNVLSYLMKGYTFQVSRAQKDNPRGYKFSRPVNVLDPDGKPVRLGGNLITALNSLNAIGIVIYERFDSSGTAVLRINPKAEVLEV